MKLLFTLLLINFQVAAQNQVDLFELLKRQMIESQKMMDKLFDDSFFGANPNDSFFQKLRSFEGQFKSPNGKWRETDRYWIYELDGEVAKEMPFDVKVKDGHVTLKGMIIKERKTDFGTQKTQYQFQNSFPVPENTDANKMEISQNKSNKVQLKFPKLNDKTPKKPIKSNPSGIKSPEKKLKPSPKTDLTI